MRICIILSLQLWYFAIGHVHSDHDDHPHHHSHCHAHDGKISEILKYVSKIPGYSTIINGGQVILDKFNELDTLSRITIAISVISLAPLTILSIFPHNIKKDSTIIKIMFGFAAGCLLGEAFLHLIPHTYLAHKDKDTEIGTFIMIGILCFYFIEKLLNMFQTSKTDETINECHTNKNMLNEIYEELNYTNALLNMLIDFIHNFMDGSAIATSFMINPTSGITTTISIFFHEIPHEISDYTILIKCGATPAKAILFQLLTGLGSLCGGYTTYYIGSNFDVNHKYVLPSLAAGGFIYISCVNIIPEILSHKNSLFNCVIESLSIVLGIYILTFID